MTWTQERYLHIMRDSASRADQNTVRKEHGVLDAMGDHEHGYMAFAKEREQLCGKPFRCLEIKRGKGLIEQKEFGSGYERASDTDALTLTARESARIAILKFLDTELTKRYERLRLLLFQGDRETGESYLYILEHGKPWKECGILENHARASMRL